MPFQAYGVAMKLPLSHQARLEAGLCELKSVGICSRNCTGRLLREGALP